MQLLEVLKNIDYELISGDLNKEITSVEYDSRKVSVGSLFVCVKGFTVDGHSYAKSAAEKDASAIVVDSTRDGFPKEELDQLAKDYDLCIVEINDTHKHLADLCANFFEHPEKKLAVYGITGTKGKTNHRFAQSRTAGIQDSSVLYAISLQAEGLMRSIRLLNQEISMR